MRKDMVQRITSLRADKALLQRSSGPIIEQIVKNVGKIRVHERKSVLRICSTRIGFITEKQGAVEEFIRQEMKSDLIAIWNGA